MVLGLATAASSFLVGSPESWCASGKEFQFPQEFSNVSGIADNGCCHYYVAQKPATLIDIDQSNNMTVAKVQQDALPSDVYKALGGEVTLHEVDYWDATIFGAVNNGTHGALVTVLGDLSPGSVSEVVDAPLSWVVADYNTEWAFAGTTDAERVFVFSAAKLPAISFLKEVKLTTKLDSVQGAALKGYNAMYLVTEAGALHTVNLTSFEVQRVADQLFEGPIRGLANVWMNPDGMLHLATASKLEHYDSCEFSV
jgi:hypothetical protein